MWFFLIFQFFANCISSTGFRVRLVLFFFSIFPDPVAPSLLLFSILCSERSFYFVFISSSLNYALIPFTVPRLLLPSRRFPACIECAVPFPRCTNESFLLFYFLDREIMARCNNRTIQEYFLNETVRDKWYSNR